MAHFQLNRIDFWLLHTIYENVEQVLPELYHNRYGWVRNPNTLRAELKRLISFGMVETLIAGGIGYSYGEETQYQGMTAYQLTDQGYSFVKTSDERAIRRGIDMGRGESVSVVCLFEMGADGKPKLLGFEPLTMDNQRKIVDPVYPEPQKLVLTDGLIPAQVEWRRLYEQELNSAPEGENYYVSDDPEDK